MSGRYAFFNSQTRLRSKSKVSLLQVVSQDEECVPVQKQYCRSDREGCVSCKMKLEWLYDFQYFSLFNKRIIDRSQPEKLASQPGIPQSTVMWNRRNSEPVIHL